MASYRYETVNEEGPTSPRVMCETDTTFWTFQRSCYSPDKKPDYLKDIRNVEDFFDGMSDDEDAWADRNWRPVYRYDDEYILGDANDFQDGKPSCRTVGIIWAEKSAEVSEGLFEAELEGYSMWARGDVYCVDAYENCELCDHCPGHYVESIGNCYGDDGAIEALAELKARLEGVDKK